MITAKFNPKVFINLIENNLTRRDLNVKLTNVIWLHRISTDFFKANKCIKKNTMAYYEMN